MKLNEDLYAIVKLDGETLVDAADIALVENENDAQVIHQPHMGERVVRVRIVPVEDKSHE